MKIYNQESLNLDKTESAAEADYMTMAVNNSGTPGSEDEDLYEDMEGNRNSLTESGYLLAINESDTHTNVDEDLYEIISFDNDDNGADNVPLLESSLDVSHKQMEDNTDRQSLDKRTKAYVYISHFLSAWGDRMWFFGVGLFLVDLSPESLRLTAIYGFSSGGAVLLFGAIIGDWVDNTPRLKAARIALVTQNLSVALCAVVVCLVYWYRPEIANYWPDEGLLQLCQALIIVIAIVSLLASAAGTIAREKDWLAKICENDKDLLASMSATMRCIDQTSLILAPALTGQIIGFANLGYGAVFIAAWNLVSVVVEYYLIWKVYENVPALRNKMYKKKVDDDVKENAVDADMAGLNSQPESMAPLRDLNWEPWVVYDVNVDGHSLSSLYMTALVYGDNSLDMESYNKMDYMILNERRNFHFANRVNDVKVRTESETSKSCYGGRIEYVSHENVLSGDKIKDKAKMNSKTETEDNKCTNCCSNVFKKLFKSFITLYIGWKTYIRYDVAFAGIGLCCLHMTVLGFDNITVGYAYLQGLNESILGVLMAAGALAGITGTVMYPIMRRCIGLERTGLFGLISQIISLSPCVLAVWAPGSPFDPFYFSRSSPDNQTMTTGSHNITDDVNLLSMDNSTTNALMNQTFYNISLANQNLPQMDTPESYLSIGLLLGGIVIARFGLWTADLTISQLFLQNIIETERGIVNGVQTSLNQMMNMLKFLLVILIPQPELFGFLVLLSFASVCLGFAFYAKYSHSARGHLFHFKRTQTFSKTQNNNNE